MSSAAHGGANHMWRLCVHCRVCRSCAMDQARAYRCVTQHSSSRSPSQCTFGACSMRCCPPRLSRPRLIHAHLLACCACSHFFLAGVAVPPLLAGVRRIVLPRGVSVAVRSTALPPCRRVRRAMATAGSCGCIRRAAHGRIAKQRMEIRQVHRSIVLRSHSTAIDML